MTTIVDDKASGTSAQHFHIASRNSNDNNNYWQQRTMSVERRGLVRKHTTYSHRVARWRQRWQSQAHMLRVKHRHKNQPWNIRLRRARATLSYIDDLVRKRIRLSSAISHCVQVRMAFSHHAQAHKLHSALCIVVWRRQHTTHNYAGNKPLCASARAKRQTWHHNQLATSGIDAIKAILIVKEHRRQQPFQRQAYTLLWVLINWFITRLCP